LGVDIVRSRTASKSSLGRFALVGVEGRGGVWARTAAGVGVTGATTGTTASTGCSTGSTFSFSGSDDATGSTVSADFFSTIDTFSDASMSEEDSISMSLAWGTSRAAGVVGDGSAGVSVGRAPCSQAISPYSTCMVWRFLFTDMGFPDERVGVVGSSIAS
jgi:hypothetical protein